MFECRGMRMVNVGEKEPTAHICPCARACFHIFSNNIRASSSLHIYKRTQSHNKGANRKCFECYVKDRPVCSHSVCDYCSTRSAGWAGHTHIHKVCVLTVVWVPPQVRFRFGV